MIKGKENRIEGLTVYGKEEERRVVKILVSSEWKKEGNFGLP